MTKRFSGVLRHQALEFGPRLLVFEMRRPGAGEGRGEFGPGIGQVMSTMRTASSRGFGGSTPNSSGCSPLSTQRQNLRSAVTTAAAGDH